MRPEVPQEPVVEGRKSEYIAVRVKGALARQLEAIAVEGVATYTFKGRDVCCWRRRWRYN